ncbi:uncharacterized protein BDV17DRAFT_287529 [Aspergillus undulatus]|uniref:uncharacterized protein n=1 Tax=Aspergillus undulatus TaxID=1810928 RepID=UPI003CCCEDCB
MSGNAGESPFQGARITPALAQMVDSFYDALGNPTSHKVPEFMTKVTKGGRFGTEASEKFAFLYYNEPPERKQQIDDEYTPACFKASFAAPSDQLAEVAVFSRTILRETKEYATSKQPGLQTAERRELFSKYAVLLNYIEILGGKPYDMYDLGLDEYQPRKAGEVTDTECY